MTSIIQQAAFLTCRTPLVQFQRLRGKINLKRPRKPHYDRALVLAVTEPRYEMEDKTKTCFQPNPKIPLPIHNPYNDIIAREVLNWLNHSRMVAVFHLNSIRQDELFPTRVLLHKSNMHLKSYGKKIIEQAVQDTRFEAIVPLFESNHCIVFSPDQNVKQLLRIVKKVPQMVLLAGIVDNRLLSRNEFMAYAQHPGLEAAQAEFIQTLNMAASHLVRQLEMHQNNFVNILDVYAKSGETTTDEQSGNEKAKEIEKSETAQPEEDRPKT